MAGTRAVARGGCTGSSTWRVHGHTEGRGIKHLQVLGLVEILAEAAAHLRLEMMQLHEAVEVVDGVAAPVGFIIAIIPQKVAMMYAHSIEPPRIRNVATACSATACSAGILGVAATSPKPIDVIVITAK